MVKTTLARLASFLAVSLAAGGCTSLFPPASFDWGHGPRAMPTGAQRIVAGGGGGAGLIANPLGNVAGGSGPPAAIVGGAGLGAAYEYQAIPQLLLRGELGTGAQVVSSAPGITFPIAGYVGAQVAGGPDSPVAGRLRLGGGADILTLDGQVLTAPYVGGDLGGVWGMPLNDSLDVWTEAHLGAKLNLLAVAAGIPLAYPTAGASLGGSWQLSPSSAMFATIHADLITFAPTGNVQLGYRQQF